MSFFEVLDQVTVQRPARSSAPARPTPTPINEVMNRPVRAVRNFRILTPSCARLPSDAGQVEHPTIPPIFESAIAGCRNRGGLAVTCERLGHALGPTFIDVGYDAGGVWKGATGGGVLCRLGLG